MLVRCLCVLVCLVEVFGGLLLVLVGCLCWLSVLRVVFFLSDVM